MVIRYLLDTNVCVDLLRGRGTQIRSRLGPLPSTDVGVSSITLAELNYGVAKSSDPLRHETILAQVVGPLPIVPFGVVAAERYGAIRADLERRGRPIGPLDVLIAAHALSLDATLVTNNEREFRPRARFARGELVASLIGDLSNA